jgi:hypothetical protein
MSNPVVNTKIERAVEAIESLTVAVAANVARGKGEPHGSRFQDVKEARDELATSFRDLLQPTLRVVGGTGQ